jgi:hypothetical protein
VACACTVERPHFLVVEILVSAIIAFTLSTGVIFVIVIIFGSNKSSDRVFRLLRWLRDKEEPPAPGG